MQDKFKGNAGRSPIDTAPMGYTRGEGYHMQDNNNAFQHTFALTHPNDPGHLQGREVASVTAEGRWGILGIGYRLLGRRGRGYWLKHKAMTAVPL